MNDQKKRMDKEALRYLSKRYFEQNRIRNYFAVIAVSLTSILFAGGFTIVIGIIQSYFRFQITNNNNNFNGFYSSLVELAPVLLIFLLLVMAVGYFTIYNIFSISVLQDIKFYGLLGTIGAEPKHIRYFMRLQADKIALFAIPIGTVAGFFIGNLLIPTIVDALNKNFNQNWEFEFSFHPLIFFFSIFFSYITLRLSCNRPGKIAISFSSIEAVKHQEFQERHRRSYFQNKNKWRKIKRDNKKYNDRKWKKEEDIETVEYHLCFFMALKNIYRNPKRTAIMTISFSYFS